MTWSTSAVAVCCSSDSVSSRVRCCSASNSRAFSIAITAWSAKVSTSSICLSVNGFTAAPVEHKQADGNPLTQKRHAEDCSKVAKFCDFTNGVFRISKNIRNLNGFARQQDAPDYTLHVLEQTSGLQVFFVLRRDADSSRPTRSSSHPSRSVEG